MNDELRRLVQEATQGLTDKGRIVEAGWQALRMMTVPANASENQIRDMRIAFFCGAQHLFSSIMYVLENGEEPTDKDVDRLSLIENELKAFGIEVASVHKPGSA